MILFYFFALFISLNSNAAQPHPIEEKQQIPVRQRCAGGDEGIVLCLAPCRARKASTTGQTDLTLHLGQMFSWIKSLSIPPHPMNEQREL